MVSRRRGSERTARAENTESSLSINLEQLGTGDELRADGAVVLVRPSGLGVGPGKAPADGGIIRFGVDQADVVPQKDAASSPHPRAPFSPAGAIYHRFTVGPYESE